MHYYSVSFFILQTMEIAIQGHPTRGKEVIQILKSLGGKLYSNIKGNNPEHILYIDYCDRNIIRWSGIKLPEYKIYTLEEFEKAFPFKIGDKVTIVGTKHPKIITGISDTQWGLRYVVSEINCPDSKEMPHISQISLYKEMKEERNITLTLDKARELYNKGGELKEIALQAFSEQELNPLPKSWEEFCKMYKVPINIFGLYAPMKYIALWKLEQLRDCYRQGWKPKPKEAIYAIKYSVEGLNVYNFCSQEFLSFQSREIAKEFLKNFERLIKEAGDLI